MFTNFVKTTEPNGKAVRAVKLLDYSRGCEKPFDLPLREHLLWSTARYVDLHGEFPDGEERFGRMTGRYGPAAFRHDDKDKEEQFPPSQPSTMWRNNAESGEALVVQAELERVRLACGTCHWCANQRKRRWERAATGWIENSALTCFATLTFGDEYFSAEWNQWIDAKLEEGSTRDGTPGFDYLAWFSAYTALRTDKYNPFDIEHETFMRKRLQSERQKMFKRLRHALGHDERFEGVKLKAHLSVHELGDLRGRLHMHFIAHFDVGELPVGIAYTRLRKFFKKHWHGHGIGFVDVQHATPEGGVEAARYLTNYLLAYQEEEGRKRVTKAKSRLACSILYRAKGTDLWFAGRPSLIPGGSLRPVDPIPPEERGGFPLPGGDADFEDIQLSEASKKLTFAEMPYEFRELAEELARANLAWRDGELWPGWSNGRERPEDQWAELPPDKFEFAQWLLSRSYKDDRRFDPLDPCLASDPEDGGGEEGFAGNGPVSSPPVSSVNAEVLGKSVSERAMFERGLGPDTVIGPKGAYRIHPDEVLRRRRVARDPSDGSIYDIETGEIIDEG